MRFLLKTAFWLSIVIMLLPTGTQSNPSQVGAADAVTAAGAAVTDMRQFCERQPGACAIGAQAVTSFGYKAQAGAKMLYEFLTDKLGPTETGSIASSQAQALRESPGSASQHTLTPADLTIEWRVPPPRRDAQARPAA
jgi:hypothetical protein